MSHKASSWLAQIPPEALNAGAFRVLFHLCDAHNSTRVPQEACFPNQETLRRVTGLSNGGLNNALNAIESAGLIRRIRGTSPDTSERRTYYILGCDFEHIQEQTPENGVSANSAPLETAKPEQTPLFEQANSTFERGKLHSTGDYPVRTSKEPVKEKEKNPKKKNSNDTIRESLISIISPDMADEFIAHRQEMKKPLTHRATKMLVSKVKGHPDPDAVFRESIANGWQGVFPDAVRGSRNDPLAPTGRPETTEELERRLLYGV